MSIPQPQKISEAHRALDAHGNLTTVPALQARYARGAITLDELETLLEPAIAQEQSCRHGRHILDDTTAVDVTSYGGPTLRARACLACHGSVIDPV